MSELQPESESIIEKIHALRMTYHVFLMNDRELNKTLHDFRQPKTLLLWDIRNYKDFDMFQIDVIRQFHNYLASAKTLVDHTRRLVEDIYTNTEFQAEYGVKKGEYFAEKSFISFVQNLRNYTLHRTLPITIATLSLGNLNGEHLGASISLDIPLLLDWDKWSSKERAYLENLGEKVALDKIIDGYTSTVEDFYRWFHKRQKELHPGL